MGLPGSILEGWITSELFTLATLLSAVTVSVMKFWKAERSRATHLSRKSTSPDSMWHSRTSGQRAHPFLEMLEIGVLLAGQPDKDKAGDLKAQRLAVQVGMIALDEAGLFQRAHAAQAGRRGDLGAARQFHIGDAAIGLQFGQDAQVDGVQLAGVQARFLSAVRRFTRL